MVIADQSKSWARVQDIAPLHFGGITKQCWKFKFDEDTPSFEDVPFFWVAAEKGDMIGVSTFPSDAAEATKSLMNELPNGYKVTGDVGLFPCCTRGVNQYGAENVESDANAPYLWYVCAWRAGSFKRFITHKRGKKQYRMQGSWHDKHPFDSFNSRMKLQQMHCQIIVP
jgi:hypothetical protein